MPMYAVFIHFNKAFDTVSREGPWIVLRSVGCREKVINLIKSSHDKMQAQTSYGSEFSIMFDVTNGTKQDCVLAPLLFALYLAAILETAFNDTRKGIYIQTRQNTKLFQVAQFKTRTLSTSKLVREMLFADDSALLSHNSEDMKNLINSIAKAPSQFNLKSTSKRQNVCTNQSIKLMQHQTLSPSMEKLSKYAPNSNPWVAR